MNSAQKILQSTSRSFEEYLSLKEAVSHLPQNPQVEADKVIIPREMWEKYQQSLQSSTLEHF